MTTRSFVFALLLTVLTADARAQVLRSDGPGPSWCSVASSRETRCDFVISDPAPPSGPLYRVQWYTLLARNGTPKCVRWTLYQPSSMGLNVLASGFKGQCPLVSEPVR